jgi:hypothetical protein
MSAVTRALDAPAAGQWIQPVPVLVSPTNRFGPPIWTADLPIVGLQSTAPDPLPLEITLLAFVFCGG